MHASRFLRRAAVMACATASVVACLATATAPSFAADPGEPQKPWTGLNQALFGYTWEFQHTGVEVTISVAPTGVGPTNEFMWSPFTHPGAGACFEMGVVHHSDGSIRLTPHAWCDNGTWEEGKVIDAAFRDTYVRDNALTLRMERVYGTPAPNLWVGSVKNQYNNQWDEVYRKGGTPNGGGTNSAGWNYFEVYSDFNTATGVGRYCDQFAGRGFSSKDLKFKINGVYQAPPAGALNFADPTSEAGFGCPGVTTARDVATRSWSVTIPARTCEYTVSTVPAGSGTVWSKVSVRNTAAYHVLDWQARVDAPLGRTVSSPLAGSGTVTLNENTATFTAGENEAVLPSGGVLERWVGVGYTGSGDAPVGVSLTSTWGTVACARV